MSVQVPALPESRLFIEGTWRDASDGASLEVLNLANTEEKVVNVIL